MIDPLDETIASLRRRIEQFKKDHPELYESESNERERNTHSSVSYTHLTLPTSDLV